MTMDREATASTDPARPEPVGDNTPIPFDPGPAAELVHFTDPRVRELAEARWRTDTGRDHQGWLVDGPRDRGNPYVREARDWLRAAVSIGLLAPIETDGSRRPILAAGDDIRCTFCGKGPDKFRTVVTGPGVNICNDCVELVRIVAGEASGQGEGPNVRVIRRGTGGGDYLRRYPIPQARPVLISLGPQDNEVEIRADRTFIGNPGEEYPGTEYVPFCDCNLMPEDHAHLIQPGATYPDGWKRHRVN